MQHVFSTLDSQENSTIVLIIWSKTIHHIQLAGLQSALTIFIAKNTKLPESTSKKLLS